MLNAGKSNASSMVVIYIKALAPDGESDNRGGILVDSLITAAARALAAGDPLGALKRVALRDDPPALALRGIAMAQLGEFERARVLIRSAARAFGSKDAVARARCIVAEAEVALASRELGWSTARLDAARAMLEERGDAVNAAHARYLEIRRLLLIGRIDAAETQLDQSDPMPLPPALRATHHLIVAGIAMRRLRTRTARAALEQAGSAARESGIASLAAEVASALERLGLPAARLVATNGDQTLLLEEVEALLDSDVFIVDACRQVVRQQNELVSLATRPVLFMLARALAEAWPADASREELVTRVFRARHADESYRGRLRVEIGRLRRLLRSLADIHATPRGFSLVPYRSREPVVLAWPVEEKHADVLALLADGESWSSSALAIALGTSQRSVQRALDSLASERKVQSFGRGRARRWTMPLVPEFTTVLLLPASLPVD